MDYIEFAQAHCPAGVVAQLEAIAAGGTPAAKRATHSLFSRIVDQPQCRAAVLAELLRRMPRDSSDRYTALLLSELRLRPQDLPPPIRRDIARMLHDSLVRPGWEREALLAFIALDIDRRRDFPLPEGRPNPGGAGFRASPRWNRALYRTNFGDARACEVVAAMMDEADSTGTVTMMFSDLLWISPRYARPLLERFLRDRRPTRSGIVGVAGPTLGEIAESYLDLLADEDEVR